MQKKRRLTNARSKQAFIIALLLTFLACVFFAAQASARPTIGLSIDKINGYNLGSDINGQFTVNAQVSSGVVRVEFYLNGTLEHTDTSAPFSWTFNTNDYPLGHANITAVAYDSAGQQATTALNQNFVKTSVVWTIIIPAVVVPAAIAAIVVVYRMRFNRQSSRLVKCPSCGHVYTPSSLSLVHVGSLQLRRCPKCGKTFFGGNLKEAPKQEETPQSDTLTEEERLRKAIDESKYENKA